jgi:hypothetical protein
MRAPPTRWIASAPPADADGNTKPAATTQATRVRYRKARRPPLAAGLRRSRAAPRCRRSPLVQGPVRRPRPLHAFRREQGACHGMQNGGAAHAASVGMAETAQSARVLGGPRSRDRDVAKAIAGCRQARRRIRSSARCAVSAHSGSLAGAQTFSDGSSRRPGNRAGPPASSDVVDRQDLTMVTAAGDFHSVSGRGVPAVTGGQLSPPWSEQAPERPPEWLHSPSAHCTMYPFPLGKLGMHVWVVQKLVPDCGG